MHLAFGLGFSRGVKWDHSTDLIRPVFGSRAEMQGPAPDGRSEVYDVDAVYDALAMSEHIGGGFTKFVSKCGRPAQPLNAFVLGMNRSGILLAFQNPLLSLIHI